MVSVSLDPGRVELKRRVVAGGVVDDEIEDDPNSGLVAAFDQRFEGGTITEIVGGCEVIGNMIPVVGRASEDRRQPEHIDRKRIEVLDPAFDLPERRRQRLARK